MSQNNNQNRNSFIQKNKTILIAGIAVIVVILLAVFLTRGSGTKTPVVEEAPVVEASTVTEGEVSTTPSGEAAYKGAIAAHEGRLITVVDGCVAEPKEQTVALGSNALLVNASNTAHTFTVGDNTYTVGERHYKTLRFADAGEYNVSCDDTQDIASIIVE